MILSKADPEIITKTVQILSKNGIVIMKCDTIYGITGIYKQTDRKIAEIKKRNPEKPFICLISDTEIITHYSTIEIPPKLKKYWPGPLTMIFPVKGSGTESIALRIPEDDFLIRILDIIKKPLISTSVNIEGKPPLNRIDQIIRNFENKVDLVINSGNLTETSRASTLINLCEKPFKILRQGELYIPDEDLV
jgi:L-threonylcarbamoyladenylate synthase